MKNKEQVFLGKTIEVALDEFECWRAQFDDYIDIDNGTYHFWLIVFKTENKIILYIEHILYYENVKAYCVVLEPVASYEGIEEAKKNCINDIDSYVNNTAYETAR